MKGHGTILCKCGNKSIGTSIKLYYQKVDGSISTYEYPERRCRECMRKADKKVREKRKKLSSY